MTLEERITADLKTAMKAKDQATLRSVRAIKAAILLAQTEEGGSKQISPEREIQILQKLVKQRQDSLAIYEQQNREELAQVEREEIAVIQRYLPAQLSEAEIEGRVRAIIERTGASSMKDMGAVMGEASREMAGQADGKTISAIVRRQLS